MSTNFRTCMFGGFDRTDVIKYIEKSAKETQERIETLEKENSALREDKERMEQALRTLHAQRKQERQDEAEQVSLQQQLEMMRAELNTAKEEADALRCEKETLHAENERLRAAASEYMSLKEHIADIEISAHRRTEEFRAKAMERLAQCISQQRMWCSQRRSTYLNMNAALAEQLRAAQETVDSADFAAFDDMIAELQQMEEELKKPDPQL